MYELKGWAFYCFSDDDLDTKKPLKDGILVHSWEEAHKLMAQAGFEYYLITLIPAKEDE